MLTQQEAEDILYGASVYGTGGGGDFEAGLKLVQNIYRNGKHVNIISLEEVEDDWFVASPYYVGSVAPAKKEVTEKLANLTLSTKHVSTIAALTLERHLGKKLNAVIATELGANIAWAMEVAAILDIPLIDADPAGRAVPELSHTTFNLHDVSIAPFALSNQYGEVLLVEAVGNHDRAEEHARSFAISSGNFAGICDHPVDGKVLKESVIANTILNSEQMGRALREANSRGVSPVDSMIKVGKGNQLIEGIITSANWEDVGGFIEGEINITSFEGGELLTIWFRNEFMYARSNGEIIAIIPELISVINLEDGLPILNPSCKEGMKVAVLTFPAPKMWETEKGLSLYGPEYIGFDRSIYLTLQENKEVMGNENE
ncbi:DUF917 domain-containing protein [Sporosarcina sp. CAU 1771]